MKIAQTEQLIDVGDFSMTQTWRVVERHLVQAVKAVDWPPGTGSFMLYPESGKRRGQGNGVVPLKRAFIRHLVSEGWNRETPLRLGIFLEEGLSVRQPGPMDATYPIGDRFFCVEWETGNISSSHRALNKMALGMLRSTLIGGALILPTYDMARYLTDRVGNFRELAPYFPLWHALEKVLDEGLLTVIAVEHDGLSEAVPRVPKMTAGRALG